MSGDYRWFVCKPGLVGAAIMIDRRCGGATRFDGSPGTSVRCLPVI
jgi:hypothetical protein